MRCILVFFVIDAITVRFGIIVVLRRAALPLVACANLAASRSAVVKQALTSQLRTARRSEIVVPASEGLGDPGFLNALHSFWTIRSPFSLERDRPTPSSARRPRGLQLAGRRRSADRILTSKSRELLAATSSFKSNASVDDAEGGLILSISLRRCSAMAAVNRN
jgi:hypothetical protein